MKLDERKLRIIKTIIDDYILTAVPVGSRTISKISDLNLSSATIRNEMSDLEDMGYLDQPHTSAGRIPSDKAYRLYVDELMHMSPLTKGEIDYIKKHFSKKLVQVQDIITETVSVLSELTNHASIIMAPKLIGEMIKHVQLVEISSGKALVIIVTNTGFVHDRLINIPKEYSMAELGKISELLTNLLKNGSVSDAPEIIARELDTNVQDNQKFFDQTLKYVVNEINTLRTLVVFEGATKLFMHPEYSDLKKAQQMLNILETKDTLYNILEKATGMAFTITIGSENQIEQMHDASIITATYKVGSMPIGSFGVVGPTRMDYGKITAILHYVGASLTQVFSNMQDE